VSVVDILYRLAGPDRLVCRGPRLGAALAWTDYSTKLPVAASLPDGGKPGNAASSLTLYRCALVLPQGLLSRFTIYMLVDLMNLVGLGGVLINYKSI